MFSQTLCDFNDKRIPYLHSVSYLQYYSLQSIEKY